MLTRIHRGSELWPVLQENRNTLGSLTWEISYLTPELATCHSAKHLAQKPPWFQNCPTAPAELAASTYSQSLSLPDGKTLQQAREQELAVWGVRQGKTIIAPSITQQNQNGWNQRETLQGCWNQSSQQTFSHYYSFSIPQQDLFWKKNKKSSVLCLHYS